MTNGALHGVWAGTVALIACKASPSPAPESAAHSPAALSSAPASAGSGPAASAPEQTERSSGTGPRSAPLTRSFEDDAVDAPPAGFSFARTGSGALGNWRVRADATAPSGANVLAQLDADRTNYRFPVAVADAPASADVRVSVRCKLVAGRVDQACGLVARYRDENNYFVTRANALEHNVRLYAVHDGKREELASQDQTVAPNVWHEYRFELRGDILLVFWDGQRVLEHHDGTFMQAGRVGVWTKADSITHFDNLRAEALP